MGYQIAGMVFVFIWLFCAAVSFLTGYGTAVALFLLAAVGSPVVAALLTKLHMIYESLREIKLNQEIQKRS